MVDVQRAERMLDDWRRQNVKVVEAYRKEGTQ